MAKRFIFGLLALLLAAAAAQPSRGDDRPPAADEQTAAVEAFLAEHAPERLRLWRVTEQIDRRGARRLRDRIHDRVRRLLRLRDDDAELYEVAVRQFQVEDQVIATLRQRRRADAATAAELDGQADVLLRELAELNLRERELRLTRLAAQVEAERERLADDRANLDRETDRLRRRFERGLRRMPRGGGQAEDSGEEAAGEESAGDE